MEWIKPNEKQPIDLTPVLAYLRYFRMPEGEIIWHEEKKIETFGYALVYIEKGVWWDGRATINSKPLQTENIIGWMEMPTPPSVGSF